MLKNLKKSVLVVLAFTFVLTNVFVFNASAKQDKEDNMTEITMSAEEVAKIAFDAYIYGLPLVEMELSKNKMTHPQYDGDVEWSQLGEFYHIREFADSNQTRLRAPNVDVLYSGAWVNLEEQPVIIYVPDADDRYYSIQINDMYSNIEGYIGRRTTGTKEGFYALVGPDFKGELGVEVDGIIEVSTNLTWVFPRVHCKGEGDFEATYEFQDGMRIVPLDKYKKHGRKALKKTYPQKDKDLMHLEEESWGTIQFFDDLNEILKNIGMPESEAELQAKFDAIGVGPNANFNADQLSPELKAVFEGAAVQAEQIITFLLNNKTDYGWSGSMEVGLFGDNYFLRAMCARGGIGGNTAEEAYYPTAYYTNAGERFNGSNKYEITFEPGSIPPVDAFWSLTIYDSATHCLVANPIDKYAIRDLDKDLQYNADGSLTLYIQSEAPVGMESNWLPSPDATDFHLIFRAYQPGQEWFTGEYTLPDIVKVN